MLINWNIIVNYLIDLGNGMILTNYIFGINRYNIIDITDLSDFALVMELK